MKKIVDFRCTYENDTGLDKKTAEAAGIRFPEVYQSAVEMAHMAKLARIQNAEAFCELPFCHTLEAEAMGARVILGDGTTAPRAGAYRYQTLEELEEHSVMDLTFTRIQEVLAACRLLAAEGEKVVLDVSGPFTIWNSLIDIRVILKAMRKKPEQMQRMFDKVQEEQLRFLKEACNYGVQAFSYADSAGAVNILGPRMMTQVTECFTVPFLKRAEQAIGKERILLVCPKTTLALLGTEHAVLKDVALPEPMRYAEACMQMVGRAQMLGQMCLKNRNYILQNRIIKEVVLV